MARSIINKNLTQETAHNYLYTSMVSHRGSLVSFAMREDGQIYYSVLDMSQTRQNTNGQDQDANNDKNYWSKVPFEEGSISRLRFPEEIMQVGYGVVPNFKIEKHDKNNKKIIYSYDNEDNPLDEHSKKLTLPFILGKTDPFYSSTAKLGAKAPFQVLSDGKNIYLFRQSIAAGDFPSGSTAIVDNTLLVDRLILSGTVLKLSREIRYQRSRHKTEPKSRKDTLSAVDVEGNPFYEPTRELVIANNLSYGNFAVLLIPGVDSEEQRWQIFTVDSKTEAINSFNIRFDISIVFDTSDTAPEIDEFIRKYEVNDNQITTLNKRLKAGDSDAQIAGYLSNSGKFKILEGDIKSAAKDALNEFIYLVRTGVQKDDFYPASLSDWPLIEYDDNGAIKKTNRYGTKYLDVDGVLLDKYAFKHGPSEDALEPMPIRFRPGNGLSASYYYQQEMGPDGKPIKNRASVMLAMGLADRQDNKSIGILNFAVSASGRLSHLTSEDINLPDINVQALDENPYRDLAEMSTVAWQVPQKMGLVDIDPNGLSTSGGVLRFAYTSAGIGISHGYSDAVEATDPLLFDDSLGRVNLYFQGKNQNFFVLYFNPTGSKSIAIEPKEPAPSLALKPRLEREMTMDVAAKVEKGSNTCTLTMQTENGIVETWNHLPQRISQIAGILNGEGELSLGTLDPIGDAGDLRAAYLRPASGNGRITLRTSIENNLVFNAPDGFSSKVA